MKIYALNGMQSHCENVKKNVALHGSVVLRGFAIEDTIQLLEGSHRMAYAIELGVPVTIVLFGENEIIPHDCDDINSAATGLIDRSAVRELADCLLKERGLYHQAIYESSEHPNIQIVDASDGNGKMVYYKLTHAASCKCQSSEFQNNEIARLEDVMANPSCAFPEKVQQIMFGEKTAFEQKVLAIGNNENRPAIAFCCLGAHVTYIDSSCKKKMETVHFAKDKNLHIETQIFENIRFPSLAENTYDYIYAAPDICYQADNLLDMFTGFRRILKPGGLLVMLDTHPFMNIYNTKIPDAQNICRSYDDLRAQNETDKRYWRMGDITRWLLASGLRLYAFIELQSEYDMIDNIWYTSVQEQLDDKIQLYDWTKNPLAAVPQWLATFAHK